MNNFYRFILFSVLFLFTACSSASSATPASPTPPSTSTTALRQTETPSPTAAPSATSAPPATVVPSLPAATPTSTNAPTPPPGPLSGPALAQALRGGGYVIYFRHAATTPIPDDANPVVLTNCTTQRNLSAAGHAQARAIGQEFQRLGIPVGRVLASPFCRALDTVRLAFNKAEIEPGLENLETAATETERETRTARLRRLLATPPDPATNTILSAHGINLSAAAQVTVAEGGAAIFRPDGAGDFTLVATVASTAWAELN